MFCYLFGWWTCIASRCYGLGWLFGVVVWTVVCDLFIASVLFVWFVLLACRLVCLVVFCFVGSVCGLQCLVHCCVFSLCLVL